MNGKVSIAKNGPEKRTIRAVQQNPHSPRIMNHQNLLKKHYRDLNKSVFDFISSSMASIVCNLGHEQLIPGPHAASSGSYDIISMTSLHLKLDMERASMPAVISAPLCSPDFTTKAFFGQVWFRGAPPLHRRFEGVMFKRLR